MKIEIELTEEAAACLWDDVTWGGKIDRPIAWIVQSFIEGRAALAVANTPEHYRPTVIAKFNEALEALPLPPPPQPTQSKPDCECGSGNAIWHGEAPDRREYCCPTCYWHRTQARTSDTLPGTT